MGDHEDGLAFFAGEGAEEFEDEVGVAHVEVAGGFVGQDDGGGVGEGAGDGDALLLAAGELVGQALGFVAEADVVEELVGALAHFLLGEAAEFAHREHDVFGGGEFGEEEVELEDEADEAVAGGGALGVGGDGHAFVGDPDFAVVLAVEQAEEVEEGGLAAAGGAGDGVDGAAVQLEADAAQDVVAHFALAEVAVNAGGAEDGRGIHRLHRFTRRGKRVEKRI